MQDLFAIITIRNSPIHDITWHSDLARDRSSRNHGAMSPDTSDSPEHLPVLAQELIEAVTPKPGDVVVDGTFGAGGHARLIGKSLGRGRYFAVDRDASTRRFVDEVQASIAPVEFQWIHATFPDALVDLKAQGVSADIVILDIGVSSMQLDQTDRGFAYSQDALLDMRMDQSSGSSASDIVNNAPEDELVRIFREYGEERFASRIASAILRARSHARVETTAELVEIIFAAIPAAARRTDSGHPARRVFQALRIAVNDELGMLDRGLEAAKELLAPGGRLGVITFHSLEDRMVKQRFASWLKACTCPPDFPICVCGKVVGHAAITRKPISASAEELAANPRSAPAKLRAIRRLSEIEIVS